MQTVDLPPPVDGLSGGSDSKANSAAPAASQPKRKPSRRASTAERRATHNAVERARRETLNSRFLDLAALLPNLSQIRRPSKSSIVNSSIAHINASRRHRLMAARELRQLKLETDAIRRELNEWRGRAGLPRVEEPIRTEGFQMVLSGEVEIVTAGLIEEDEEDYGNDGYGDDDLGGPGPMVTNASLDGEMLKRDSPFAHNASHSNLQLQTILPRPNTGGPMTMHSPTSPSFENPAMSGMYPQNMQPFYMNNGVQRHEPESKWPGYTQQQQFTPPASSHGALPAPQQQQYAMSFSRQAVPYQGPARVYGSPVEDDASSSGSSPVPGQIKRERSGSNNAVNSGFDMAGVPRRMGSGWDERMNMGGMDSMGRMNMAMGMNNMNGMAGRNPQAVSVGGGANGFAAMML